MSKSTNISGLLFKYLQGTLTTSEAIKLQEWKEQSPANQQFFDELSREAINSRSSDVNQPLEKHLEARIFNKITAQVPELQGNVVKMTRTWRYSAAAAIALFVIGAAAVMYTTNRTGQAVVAKVDNFTADDVDAPAENFASITLADGQQVDLNNSTEGTLASQGKMEVVKSAEGLIIYRAATGEKSRTVQLNTLTNPKGSNVIGMLLEDGTKVWLNAGSSLTYPVAFIGNERTVTITGEAYFEVAKNKKKPFKVKRDNMEIEVLGTHFNVNAFSDDPDMKVTLLEGSVKVSSGKSSGLLKPGEQAKVKNENINVHSDVSIEQVMAWKNGYFSFERASVADVMRDIARWYNIDVVYEGQIPDEHFGGDLRRNSKLSSILKVLEKTGVKFRIEGTKVSVFR